MRPNTIAVRLFSYSVCMVCVFHAISTDAILSKPREAVDTRVQQLFDLVQTSQVQESTTFIPFYSFHKQKGVFPVYTKGNFHGTFDQTLMRDQVRFYDNNIFSTCYILTLLLEAFSHGGAPQPSEKQMLLGIDSFQDYQDKNRPYNHSIVSFWPLKYNPAKHFWQAYPANVVSYLDIIEYLPVKIIAELLGLVGLRDMDKFFEDFYKDRVENKALSLLPADLDTSSIHLAFGATLKNLKKEFPHAWRVWNSRNPNRISVFDAIKHYSYRPFSDAEDSNSIDPRTYFYLRHFLDDAKAKGNDVALITTWAQTLSEQKRQFEKGSTMARGINNICLGVTANAVLGITRVMGTVAKASEWLVHSSVGSQFKPHGALFSSSNKWSRTLPYMYPGNRYQFLNGTEIWPWSSYPPDHLTSYMVRGYIPPEQYGTLMAEQGFGHQLPRDFHGYNADNHKYMWYWESEPFTYAINLLALSKYRNIIV
ncbi:hypothetical protein PoB_002550700 [Plakobranchus ocellatus]|uniref:Transmembrane protein n=1 Tax=Plakobranchus ocellatus TaxID=259542 RepID=A0AAV3ZV92_9GAST|nr:hypothetical protein PoB_002550700 [Plakobranchus ocellatus]